MPDGLNVLLVDDDNLFAAMISAYLKDHNIKLDLAESVSTAKKTFDPQKFNAAIIDWNLPDGTGPELAKHIHKKSEKFTLIFLSGSCNTQMIEQAKIYTPFPIMKKNDFRADIVSKHLFSTINA